MQVVIWQGETSASEDTTQIAESHFASMCGRPDFASLFFPHKHPALIGRHTGGGGDTFVAHLHFSGNHKGESLRVQVHSVHSVHSVGDSMEGMPG